jgi:hypothetical protein
MVQIIVLSIILSWVTPILAQNELTNAEAASATQAPTPDLTELQEQDKFWREKVDITTPWGVWLDGTKMYWWQMSQAIKNTIYEAAKIDMANTPPAEIIKKLDEAQIAFYKAQQQITAPLGLEGYHQKNLEISAAIVSDIPDHKRTEEIKELRKKLSKEAHSELVTTFLKHKVPLEIIEEFTTGRRL